jgi:hypothetical protein
MSNEAKKKKRLKRHGCEQPFNCMQFLLYGVVASLFAGYFIIIMPVLT